MEFGPSNFNFFRPREVLGRIPSQQALEKAAFGPSPGHFRCNRRFRTDYSIQYQQFGANHPQVGQRKQRLQLGGVLGQPAVAHFDVAELALDDPKRVLDLG